MRQITKEIQVYIDGSPLGFRLTKPDAFSCRQGPTSRNVSY